MVPVVAIGASAGGIAALRELMSSIRERAEFALVVVQHLPATKPCRLVEILGRSTSLAVGAALDGLAPERGCVYVALPGRVLRIVNGVFHTESAGPARPRAGIDTIDSFLKSLAIDRGSNAMAVILSGTGRDGSAGTLAIKRAGGVVLVQDPSTASFEGMPRAALASGCVDFVLAPRQLGAQLSACVSPPRQGLDEATSLRLQLATLKRELAASREEVRVLNDELDSNREHVRSCNAELEGLQLELLANADEMGRERKILRSGAVIALHLDHELRVSWFTSAIGAVFPLLAADKGRSITEIAQNFADHEFITDVQSVIENGQSLEADVLNFAGQWFSRCIHLHRSGGNEAAGAVVTFTDISKRKATEEALRRASSLEPRASANPPRDRSALHRARRS